ncbi:hypothetical protein QTH89_22535 [Variovorax sp. J22G21]|uniref:hypothetical protein n=1 Tax=Variovorax fucosicus TaxID=3053517 RepID=UPI00257871F7|nr:MULTISPECIES: hypothetical protein [unclassified Variovorax]MDM0039230.1 hypothetical protein [Variovorax sp. J22R193]MDM0055166.1 hypothetical protein [Variovorax sp. J22G47]MDM0064006.1 hypothetical protein [Variovorax sp. J22G21]
MQRVASSRAHSEGANHFRVEHQRGVLLAGNAEPVHVSLAGRDVAERGAEHRGKPQTPPGFLDREEITGVILGSLHAGLSAVEVTGEAGSGKTWLLRHAGEQAGTLFRDGVVCVPDGMLGGFDLLQSLFDAFYSVDARCRPARVELRARLSTKRVLLLADDAALDDRAIEQLRDIAPDCAVLMTTSAPTLQREATPIALGGLPTSYAMTLLEQLRGGPLSGASFGEALERCHALRGNPEQLARSAPPGSVVKAEQPGLPSRTSPAALAMLGADARAVLDTLAAFSPYPVQATVLAELCGKPDAHALVLRLCDAGWIYEDEDQLRLLPHAVPALQAAPALVRHRRTAGLVRLGHHIAQQSSSAAPALLVMPLLWLTLAQAREADALADVVALGRAWDLPLTLATRWDAARYLLERHAEAARALGNPVECAWALHQRGTLELAQGYPPRAAQLLREAFKLAQLADDTQLAASARYHLGWLMPEAPPEGWDDAPQLGLGVAASDSTIGQGHPSWLPPPTPALPAYGTAVSWGERPLLGQLGVAFGLGLVGALGVAGLLRLTEKAELALVPAVPIDFGHVTLSAASGVPPYVLLVQNAGSRTAAPPAPQIGGAAASQFSVEDDCQGRELDTDETCRLVVRYAPTRPGKHQAQLVLGARAGLPLSGEALADPLPAAK